MSRNLLNEPIKFILNEIAHRTAGAAQIAKAANACADAGSIDEAVILSMDIEQIIYECSRLQDAVSLLNRISKEQ